MHEKWKPRYVRENEACTANGLRSLVEKNSEAPRSPRLHRPTHHLIVAAARAKMAPPAAAPPPAMSALPTFATSHPYPSLPTPKPAALTPRRNLAYAGAAAAPNAVPHRSAAASVLLPRIVPATASAHDLYAVVAMSSPRP